MVGCKFVIKTTREPDAPISHQASQQSLRGHTRTLPFVPTMEGALTAFLAHSKSRKKRQLPRAGHEKEAAARTLLSEAPPPGHCLYRC